MSDETTIYASAIELLDSIFTDLSKSDIYDQEIVTLTKTHLGQSSIHSKAGKKLAEDLIVLAQRRVEEGRG
jgi:hypothetical protein